MPIVHPRRCRMKSRLNKAKYYTNSLWCHSRCPSTAGGSSKCILLRCVIDSSLSPSKMAPFSLFLTRCPTLSAELVGFGPFLSSMTYLQLFLHHTLQTAIGQSFSNIWPIFVLCSSATLSCRPRHPSPLVFARALIFDQLLVLHFSFWCCVDIDCFVVVVEYLLADDDVLKYTHSTLESDDLRLDKGSRSLYEFEWAWHRAAVGAVNILAL